MPDQNICSCGPRGVELQEFGDLASSLRGGLRLVELRCSSSLTGECGGEFSCLSTAFLAKSCSGDVKPSPQKHSPSLANQALAAAAVPATGDSADKASTATAAKSSSKRGRTWNTVGVAGRAVVKSVETKGGGEEARLVRKRKAESPPNSSEAMTMKPPESVEIASNNNNNNNLPEYRGVRVRPGVKGFLVEIRPKRWKKTIWLGTYPTSPEAAGAFDAGIFYTGKKNIPYNFWESEGSFPPLPEHLSLNNFDDPDVMEQSKRFVKERAVEAAARRRMKAAATTKGRLSLTRNKADVNETGLVGMQGYNFTSGSPSEINKGGHVQKDEESCDIGSDPVTPNPFQNLEPLLYDLPRYDDEQLLGNNYYKDCWGRISVAVNDYYLPQMAMSEDEDLDIAQQQTPNPTDAVLFHPWHDEQKQSVAAETSFESIFFGSERDRNLSGLMNPPDSWELHSFDQGVRFPLLLGDDMVG